MTALPDLRSSSPHWPPLAGCDQPSQDAWLGYVEAEYTYVAPLQAGRIVALEVDRGDQVQAGQPLFTLESDAEQAARDQAAAELAQAESDLADLQKGDRPEDLAIIQAQLDKAQASLALVGAAAAAPREDGQRQHHRRGGAGRGEVPDPGRPRQHRRIRGAPRRRTAAGAHRQDRRSGKAGGSAQGCARRRRVAAVAPAGEGACRGRIEDVFFRAGETASAGQGVVSLLPPDKLKLRFFVPEPELGATHGRAEGRHRAATAAPPSLDRARSASSRRRRSSRRR